MVPQSALAASLLLVSVQDPAVVVLDFDAGELVHVPGEPSDPDERTTPFGDCAGTWPPLDDPDRELGLVHRVGELFSAYNLVVVADEPPCEGPYVRVVIGPFEGCGPGIGYAESGCDRRIGHGIAHAKLGPDDGYDLVRASALIAHEVGHALGLAHVDDSEDIMHPSLGSGEKTFVDRCNPTTDGVDATPCQLIGYCPVLDPRGQNSHFGLMTLLGPAPPEAAQVVCSEGTTGDEHGPSEGDSSSGEPLGTEGDVGGCECGSVPGSPASAAWMMLLLPCGRPRPRLRRSACAQVEHGR